MTGKQARMVLLSSTVLAAFALLGAAPPGASAAAAQPAQIPAQPEVSTSFYIDAPPTTTVLTELDQYGILQGEEDCQANQGQAAGTFTVASTSFLDFGAQDVDGQETWSTAGLIGNPATPQYTNSWIEQAVESFAEGYNTAADSCYVNQNGESIFGDIYYGTGSDGDTPTSAQVKTQADNWFNMGAVIENAVQANVSANAGTELNDAQIGPANDIEPSFSESPSTMESWASEMDQDETTALNNGTLPAGVLSSAGDYGSADGCPTSGVTSSSQCVNGWKSSDLEAIMGTSAEAAYPQIYISPQAQQWAAFCVYFDGDWALSPLDQSGILSDPNASGFLTASGSWDDINSDLEATGNSDCETQLPAYETTMENQIQS